MWSMTECTNCGNKVSEQYAKVKYNRTDTIPACPECEDRKLESGEVHEYRG